MAREIDEEIRRRTKELVALHELEPDLKALFVEGAWDRRLLRWFFREVQQHNVQVSEVSIVHFEKGELEALNLDARSKKDSVIGLIRILTTAAKRANRSLYGLVDLDTEGFFGLKWASPNLLHTDYTSMELYFFDSIPIEKFIELVLHGFPIDAATLLDQLAPILETAFQARLANESLALQCDWLNISRCCEIKNNKIIFDDALWVERYLNKCSQHGAIKRFKDAMREFEKRRNADARLQMHGHDFIDLLGWTIMKLKNGFGLFRDRECLARTLIGCVELNFIENEQLFLDLRRVFRR